MIVVYESYTGFTKQYAVWIAEELNCEYIKLSEFKKNVRAQEDIIFGGWIMGSSIAGLEKIKKLDITPKAVFAVGAFPKTDEVVNQIEEINKVQKVFYMQGGMKPEKQNFFVRAMLKVMKKGLVRKPNKTDNDEFMITHLCTSWDSSSKEQIKPLLDVL